MSDPDNISARRDGKSGWFAYDCSCGHRWQRSPEHCPDCGSEMALEVRPTSTTSYERLVLDSDEIRRYRCRTCKE